MLRPLRPKSSGQFENFLPERIWPAFAGAAEPAAIFDAGLLAGLAEQAREDGEAGAPPAAEAGPLLVSGADRAARVAFGGTETLSGGTATPRSSEIGAASGFTVYFTDDFASGLVVDESTRRILEGGPGDWSELGGGRDDLLELAGDFSEGFALPAGAFGLDRIVLHEDGQYFLLAGDDAVAAGATVTIDGSASDRAIGFDGSQETDGQFIFLGGAGDDLVAGGGGDDRLYGGLGADGLGGGGGRDVFVYTSASESTGASHDLLADFDPAEDRIDLPVTVSGFAATIAQGRVSSQSFDDDLSAAIDASRLGAGQAVWFTPDAGDFAGTILLIVDGNGEPGYQAGEDFIIALSGPGPEDLSGNPGIFL